MVFRNEKQRRGFFARISELKAQHERKVQKQLDDKIKREQKELDVLNQKLKSQRIAEKIRVTKLEQIKNQTKQLDDLKKREKEAKAELYAHTTRGRAVAFLKREVGAAKKFATSKHTQKTLKKISKNIGL